jgi:hypothetical protein
MAKAKAKNKAGNNKPAAKQPQKQTAPVKKGGKKK